MNKAIYITKNDIRIGNWLITKTGRYVMVESIDDGGINISSAYQGGLDRDEMFEDLKPILITDQILIKCGFKRNDKQWEYPHNFFLQIKEHGQWINNQPIGEIKYMAYKSGIGAIKQVKHLHDLQNLFYAIMEKELGINL